MRKKHAVKLLPPHERDILKHRSYQIMLYLFYVEDLKSFIIGSLKTTNLIHGIADKGWKLNDYLNMIVKDGVITQEEKDELVSLIDFRNDISHEIHKMVNDLGASETSIYQITDINGKVKENYQYGALIKIKILTEKIHRGFQSRYAMMASLDKFIFEPAERALEHESRVVFKRMLKEELKSLYEEKGKS